jgi:hypothetical protein
MSLPMGFKGLNYKLRRFCKCTGGLYAAVLLTFFLADIVLHHDNTKRHGNVSRGVHLCYLHVFGVFCKAVVLESQKNGADHF